MKEFNLETGGKIGSNPNPNEKLIIRGGKFNLSDKKCNVIINKVDLNKYQTIGDLEIRGKETLEWKDGFFKEDVKEFIRLILEEELEGKDLFIKIKKLAGDKLI